MAYDKPSQDDLRRAYRPGEAAALDAVALGDLIAAFAQAAAGKVVDLSGTLGPGCGSRFADIAARIAECAEEAILEAVYVNAYTDQHADELQEVSDIVRSRIAGDTVTVRTVPVNVVAFPALRDGEMVR